MANRRSIATPIRAPTHSFGRVESREREFASIDFAILRERYGERSVRLGFDPRKSPEAIAAQLNVSSATVRRRLQDWRRRGFFLGYNVLPHPSLLGGRLAARVLEFPDALAQERAIRTLRLTDGVVEIDPSRNMLLVAYFVDSDLQADRRARQLRSIDGAREIGTEMWFEFRPCSRRMSVRDWRLVRALRQNPEAKLAALSSVVGQSVRTTSRRLDSLLDDDAVMFDPILDFSRFTQTLADLNVHIEPSRTPERIESEIRALHPESMRAWGPTSGDATGATRDVQMMVTARAAAELDALAARVAQLPGVDRAFLWYGRSTMPVNEWLDERIETILRQRNPSS